MLKALLDVDPIARAEWEKHQKLRSDPRITPLGRFMRAWSIDELPQLLNVLRGDMSLVGPRPIVRSEMSRYGVRLISYLSARPGITGAWQVNGRSDLCYEDRVVLDANYVRDWRFLMDLTILLRTVGIVIGRRGSC